LFSLDLSAKRFTIRIPGVVIMVLDLKTVEALSPDQASLKAAAKLMKPGKWPLRAQNNGAGLIWGECQGSGANPYRVIGDVNDHGYKCTCPSRKFPCKHTLALMWMYADSAADFTDQDTPEWVTDWLGRRRKTTAAARPAGDAPVASKSLAEAQEKEPEEALDPKVIARREQAALKRAADTERTIRDGLDELEQWIADQLRLGLSGFLQDFNARCRRIAARLVDAKAAALASRVDEMPARLMALPSEERLDATVTELGKLVLLARAWRTTPDNPEIRRSVASAENREQILANPDALRIRSNWEVLGEDIQTRRDGLVSQSTWLLDLMSDTPRFALLLDFFPASAGRRSSAFTSGERFDAELVFYPATLPLRALIAERGPVCVEVHDAPWPGFSDHGDPLCLFADALDAAPWTLTAPIILPAGRICAQESGPLWWRSLDGDGGLPVDGDIPLAAQGVDLDACAAMWTGTRVQLLAAQTCYGRIGFHEQ